VGALRQRLGAEVPGDIGFFDLPGESPSQRRESRAAALARCRVLVALCSPAYFTDLECHSEWQAFRGRPAGRGGSAAEATVSVLWERLWAQLPPGTGLDRAALADAYGVDGLRAALARPRLHLEYEHGVRLVADEILRTADRTGLEAIEPLALPSRPEPWQHHPLERTLRILVLACTRAGGLPTGCDPERYGERPQDWRPYGATAPLPVAELATELATAHNCHVEAVEDFRADAAAGSASDGKGPCPPVLLLLDRWALLDDEARKLLLGYNDERRHPMAVMVPWDPGAPDAQTYERELQALTLNTLDRAVGRPKPDFEPLRRGIPDPGAFSGLLPRAIHQARLTYFARRS
jgi:FxsC-like protein